MYHPSPTPRVFAEPYEVDARLHELGLTRPPFIQAIRQGDLERRLCTADDALGAPGYAFWNKTLRTLREELRPLGWRRHEFMNIPVAINDTETIAIAVSSGDDLTGSLLGDPATKNVKGGAADWAIDNNLRFDFDDIEEGTDFWYFLIHVDNEGELHGELSLPSYRDDASGLVTGWSERILLGDIGESSAPRRKTDDTTGEPDAASAIDVPVLRKPA